MKNNFSGLIKKISLLLLLAFSAGEAAYSHSVQVGYCTNCNGDLRVYVEHWHGSASPSSTTMDIEVTINGVTTTVTGSPGLNIQNTGTANLPECVNPITIFGYCPNDSGDYLDWVTYDFPNVPCGVPVSIKIISGNTVFTTDGCNMFPANSGTFNIPCDWTTPRANFTFDSVCVGTPVQFTDSTTPPPYITGWDWDFDGDGTVDDTTQNPTHVFPSPGTYPVNLFVTASSFNGCTLDTGYHDTTINVVVSPSDVIADFAYTQNSCSDPVMFYDSSSSAANNIVGWNWDFDNDGTIDDTTQNPSHFFPTSGTYQVYLRVDGDGGCGADTILPVTTLPIPVANFTNTAACENSAMNFTNTSSVSSGSIVSAWWDFDDTDTSVQMNPSHVYTSDGTYNVTLIVTSDLGCTDTIVQQVVVDDIPDADFTTSPVCVGDTTFFTDQSTVNTDTVVSWNWDFGDGQSSTQQNPSHLYNTVGNYVVTLTATANGAAGCVGTYQDTIYVEAVPTPDFTMNPVCEYDDAVFVNNTNTYGTLNVGYSWDFGDMTTSTQKDPNHNYASEGTYNVHLTATTPAGCTDDTIKQVTIWDEPQAQLATSDVCVYDTLPFADNSTTTSTLASWNWDFGDGAASTQQNPSHKYSSEGIYTAQLVVTTTEGCKDTATDNQVEIYPKPEADFGAPDECLNSKTEFKDSSSVSTAVFGSEQILNNQQWTFGDGNSGTGPSPDNLYGNFGTYNTTLYVVSNHGCRDTVSKIVKVHPNPVARFESEDTTGCTPVQPSFTNNSTIPQTPDSYTLSYDWDFGNDTGSTQKNPTAFYTNEKYDGVDYYDVKLTVTSNEGCTDSETAYNVVEVYPIPKSDYYVQPQPTTYFEPDMNFVDESIGAVKWTWYFGDGYTDTIQHPEHFYQDSGMYKTTQIVENHYGCTDTSSRLVEIKPEYAIFIPDAFTPNKDGINDTFFPGGFGIKELEMKIFDRWGELLYQGDGFGVAEWDGTYMGRKVKTDVYVYRITVKDVFNETHTYTGKVSLLR